MLKQAIDDPDGTVEPDIFDARPLYGYSGIEHAIEKLETSGETQSSADGQSVGRMSYSTRRISHFASTL